jgi:hypothetical protein
VNILIAIEGCEAHRERWPVIKETWSYAGCMFPMPVQFFPFRFRIEWFTGPKLNVPDDYLSLPQKTKAMCQWALAEGYDWMLKADSDSYISVSRALASSFENHDYSGFVTKALYPTWLTYPYCSGPSYWLSRKACEILAAADWSQYDNRDGLRSHQTEEDCMVGAILFAHGIAPHHDPRYVITPVLPENDSISYHLSLRGPYTNDKMREAHQRMNP